MLTATVVGNVWSTRRLAEIPNGAFLEVEAEGTGTRLVARRSPTLVAWFPESSWKPIRILAIGAC